MRLPPKILCMATSINANKIQTKRTAVAVGRLARVRGQLIDGDRLALSLD